MLFGCPYPPLFIEQNKAVIFITLNGNSFITLKTKAQQQKEQNDRPPVTSDEKDRANKK